MPKRGSVVYCLNHPEQPLSLTKGFNALVKLSKKGSVVSFELDKGLPCVSLICSTCGYVELYYAPPTGLWNRDDDTWDLEENKLRLQDVLRRQSLSPTLLESLKQATAEPKLSDLLKPRKD